MQAVPLNNGVEMPILSFGVYQIPDDETELAVTQALEAGYRSLDTAAAYQNERAVGRAIAKSGIPRDDLFITTKLWVQDAGDEANTLRAFDTSLQRLGLDHIDLYLIHQPFGDFYTQWRAMRRIHADGRARAIGVSNLPIDRLIDLAINNEVTPAVNQVETHPFRQTETVARSRNRQPFLSYQRCGDLRMPGGSPERKHPSCNRRAVSSGVVAFPDGAE